MPNLRLTTSSCVLGIHFGMAEMSMASNLQVQRTGTSSLANLQPVAFEGSTQRARNARPSFYTLMHFLGVLEGSGPYTGAEQSAGKSGRICSAYNESLADAVYTA